MSDIMISVGCSSLLALLAIYKKALTRGGVGLAWLCSIIITYCGGLGSFAILAATFVFTMIAGKISGKKKEIAAIEKRVHAKSGKRDAMQIFCNVGLGTIVLLVGKLMGNSSALLVYGAIMAASSADSMASELGILSTKAPVDICTLRKTQRGLSGGVTVLGLMASLLGAFLIALIYLICTGGGLFPLVFITAAGFLGALIDSIMGSLLQAKYRCEVCGTVTEKKTHCDAATTPVKGFSCITNDIVNLLNNAAVAISSIGVLYLLAR